MLLDQIEQLNELSQQEQESILGDIEWELCKADPLYWTSNYAWMRNTREGVLTGPGIDLWPKQEDYFLDILAGVSQIVGKSRQVGASALWTLADDYTMLFDENVALSCIAQDEEWSMFHLDLLKWVYWLNPSYLRRFDPIVGKQRDTLTKFQLTNGCSFSAFPCSSSSARGGAYRRIRLEEFAHWPHRLQKLVWTSVRGGVGDKGGQVGIISTAAGEGDEYHRLWQLAEKGGIKIKPTFLSCWTNPARDQAWYDAEKIELGAEMEQEHPRTPREMFIASGTKYFDLIILAILSEQFECEPIRREMEGQLRVYADPVRGRSYVLGADVADGGGDACSADVLDVRTGEQVAHYHSETDSAGEFGDVLYVLGERYNWAFTGPERNNMGHATCEVLIRKRYPHLFRHQHYDQKAGKTAPRVGWITNGESRPIMLSNCRDVIRDQNPVIHDPETFKQLRQFGWYKGRWDHPPRPGQDDAVFSWGIAQQLRTIALHEPERRKDITVYQDAKPLKPSR